ncbi:MAG: TolC family protein, partial [Chitinophagaceae bacterium]
DVVTPPVELIPVEPLGALQPDAVYQSALQNLPQQRYNALRIQAAQKNVAATRGAMYPTISAGAGVQSNYADVYTRFRQVGTTTKTTFTGNVNGTGAPVYFQQTDVPVLEPYNPTYFSQIGSNLREYVVLQLNVPIFNGGQARTAWKRSQLNLQNLQLQQTGDSLTIKQDIYKAYADAVNALEKFNAAGKAVDANQRAYDFASKRSAIGLLSTFELLTAQTNLFTAQLQRSSAQFEYVFRIKLLEFYKGQGLKL